MLTICNKTITCLGKQNLLTHGSIYDTRRLKLTLSKADKLLQKALESPTNVRFEEFITLCEHFGLTLSNSSGSHFVYSRKEPKIRLSIQRGSDGKAKPYQIKQLLDWANENDLI